MTLKKRGCCGLNSVLQMKFQKMEPLESLNKVPENKSEGSSRYLALHNYIHLYQTYCVSGKFLCWILCVCARGHPGISERLPGKCGHLTTSETTYLSVQIGC